MREFNPLRQLSRSSEWKEGDVLVLFGELFQRGYANGLVDEAKKIGMKVIYSTVGRRDEAGRLRPLNEQELATKTRPLINVPLEAGFDLTPAKDGTRPVDQLEGLKLSEWQSAKMSWDKLEDSRQRGIESFRQRVSQYMEALEKEIPDHANVLFVHTMAGGVPRAKIIMPAMNRLFKGHGDRFASSAEFWQNDMGRFCAASFKEVTAETLRHLVDLSTPLRARIEKQGHRVSYVAYGYHGTEILVRDQYHWQSYSPYLQGFAKLELENIAANFMAEGVRVSVYNAPEILTDSSSIFLGVEVSLYPLMGALQKECLKSPLTQQILTQCAALLKPEFSLDGIMDYTANYFSSKVIQAWSNYPAWPQHNGQEQMDLMRKASTDLINMHSDTKKLLTADLSEVVFRSCGKVMLRQSWEPNYPVWWIGHDIVARAAAE